MHRWPLPPISPALQAYYDKLDTWLGPEGVEGWIERRELDAQIRRERRRLARAEHPRTDSNADPEGR